jgi:hypothetical protein
MLTHAPSKATPEVASGNTLFDWDHFIPMLASLSDFINSILLILRSDVTVEWWAYSTPRAIHKICDCHQ